LHLTNASTIDCAVITNHGEIESVTGTNSFVGLGDLHSFPTRRSSDLGGLAGPGSAPDTDPVNTLVLDNDYLTNSIGSNGTVLVKSDEHTPELKSRRDDVCRITNDKENESVTGTNTIVGLASGDFTNDG